MLRLFCHDHPRANLSVTSYHFKHIQPFARAAAWKSYGKIVQKKVSTDMRMLKNKLSIQAKKFSKTKVKDIAIKLKVLKPVPNGFFVLQGIYLLQFRTHLVRIRT